MKTALVTGGAGFLGSHLCERLLKEGYRVVAVDNLYTGSRANMKSFAKNPNFTFVKADISVADILNTETQRKAVYLSCMLTYDFSFHKQRFHQMGENRDSPKLSPYLSKSLFFNQNGASVIESEKS